MRTALAATLAILVASAATAATFTVATDGSGDYTTVAAAVTAANASADAASEVVLAPGDYPVTAPVTVSGPVTVKSQSGDPADTSVYTLTANGVFILGSASATLSGICVSNGTATATCTGGNVTVTDGGTVTNCWIAYGKAGNVGNKKAGGIGGQNAVVTHCRIFGNKTTGNGLGTGIYATGTDNVITRSEFFGNDNAANTDSGNGAIWIAQNAAATISHCVITNNRADYPCARSAGGGGIYTAGKTLIEWCLVAGNVAARQTGGGGICARDDKTSLIRHCTIVGNVSDISGGVGSYGNNTPYMENCIVWGNRSAFMTTAGQPEFCALSSFRVAAVSNICSSVSIGTGPVVADPMFVDEADQDYRLSKNSPCIGAGTDGLDLGYFQHDPGDFECGILVDAIEPQREGVRTFTARARGAAASSPSFRWRLDGGAWSAWSQDATYAPDLAPGLHTVELEAQDGTYSDAAARTYHVAPADVYLALDGATPAIPYATRATAAADFAEALRYCADGTTLHVSDGDYPVRAEQRVRRRVAIVSDNGPAKTSLYREGRYNAGSAHRILALGAAGSLLSGFTVSNGYSLAKYAETGSAASFASSVVTNCVFTLNRHNGGHYIGGAAVLSDNSVLSHVEITRTDISGQSGGGGLHMTGASARIEDSLVANNKGNNYYLYGTGISCTGGKIIRCVFTNNVNGGIVDTGNGYPAGAVHMLSGNLLVENCLFADNVAHSQGGAIWMQKGDKTATIVNSTFVRNYAHDGAAIKREGGTLTLLNCVFDGNITNKANNLVSDCDVLPATCTVAGNCFGAASPNATAADVVGDPRFRDPRGDYRLKADSPARDIGQAYNWFGGAFDLARRGRAWRGTPDAGCLEYRYDATVLQAR